MTVTFELEESDRLMVLLALAELRLRRPGWAHATREIAKQLGGEKVFDDFKRTSVDTDGKLRNLSRRPNVERLGQEKGRK